MVWERTPARSSKNLDFRGPRFTVTTCGLSSSSSTEERDNTTSTRTGQARDNTPLWFGVREKHDKNNPKKFNIKLFTRRWYVIEETIRRLTNPDKNSYYYLNMMPLLKHRPEYRADGTMLKKSRKRRSQRIEAMNLVLPALLKTFNLKQGSCGYYEERADGRNYFIYFNYDYYVKKTGLPLNRIKRCMKVLIEEGACTVDSIYKEDEYGNVRTIRVIIKLTNKLFQMVGMERRYLEDLVKAADAFKKAEDAAIGRMARLKITQANIRAPKNEESPAKNIIGHLVNQVGSILPTYGAPKREASKVPVVTVYSPYQDQRVLAAALELQNDTRVEVADGKWEKPDLKECVRQVCLKFGYDPPH